MGLKNITKTAEKIKYNGIERVVAPGAVIDVRDFDINNNEVMSVESILIDKHRDGSGVKIFEHIKTLGNMTDAQINAEIKRLQDELNDLQEESRAKDKDVEVMTKENLDLKTALGIANEEIEKLKAEIASKPKK